MSSRDEILVCANTRALAQCSATKNLPSEIFFMPCGAAASVYRFPFAPTREFSRNRAEKDESMSFDALLLREPQRSLTIEYAP